ncbi:MAG: hypothetical protein H0V17_28360, partial [Deltaproteobacteria bacterium]|nr:hypothetical protein [Deltaproteobacteria bacterium]
MATIDFTPGARVGRYEIVEQIGTGGMAEVYLARGPGEMRVAIPIAATFDDLGDR